MNCPHCDSLKDSVIMTEKIPCGHCSKDNTICHHLCPDCGFMWRDVNDVVVPESMTCFEDLMNSVKAATDELMSVEYDNEFTEGLLADIQKQQRKMDGDIRMVDYIHKCLKCHAVANEVRENTYKCLSCGFEWEIVKIV